MGNYNPSCQKWLLVELKRKKYTEVLSRDAQPGGNTEALPQDAEIELIKKKG